MAVALGTLFELRLDHFGGNSASTDDSSVAEGLTAAALAALELGGCAADAADAADATATDGGDGTAREAASSSSSSSSTGPTCIACGVGVAGAPGFASAEEQRSHFSLDWHRYNVKRRVAGQAPVGEAQFAALLEEDERALEVGSISGSESEADSDDEDDDDGDEGVGAGGAAGPQFAWTAPDGKRYGCWRPLVAPDRDHLRGAAPPSAAACLSELRSLRQRGGRWAVVMLRGGHFAAAVFGVDPTRVANPRQADKFEVLAHKSAHRYVVRAGQGGRQSAKDASGKYAKSAGSRLRRYNEVALARDVAEALGGWRELLGSCGLVFVHAPSSNWQQLFGGEAPLLDRGDPRYRRVPFTTRRPTFSETKRILRILVTLYQLPLHAPAAADGSSSEQQQQQQQLEAEQQRRRQQQAAAAEPSPAEVAAAAAAAAAEEAAAAKRAEKKARQKAKQREQRQAEAAVGRAAAEAAAAAAADDEIGAAAAAVAAMSDRLTAKPPPVSGKASGAPPRLSAKPRPNEGADVRRARMAAAAEARMKALQAAAQQQQLH